MATVAPHTLYPGQKVFLKELRFCQNSRPNITTDMEQYFGTQVTICKIDAASGYFRLAEDFRRNLYWNYSSDWIDWSHNDPNYKPPTLNELF